MDNLIFGSKHNRKFAIVLGLENYPNLNDWKELFKRQN